MDNAIFEKYPLLLDVKTSDIALSTRNDVPGILITWVTRSVMQHTALYVWLNSSEYEQKKSKIDVGAYDEHGKINKLCLLTITKRRLFDMFTGTFKRGLVLCSISDFASPDLVCIYRRPLSSMITNENRVLSVENFIKANIDTLFYETDIRSMMGVAANIPYAPDPNKVICTGLIHKFLTDHHNYPNVKQGASFILPKRHPATLRAVDFSGDKNQSPVLGDYENIVYGSKTSLFFGIFHPFNVGMIVCIFILIVLLSLFIGFCL